MEAKTGCRSASAIVCRQPEVITREPQAQRVVVGDQMAQGCFEQRPVEPPARSEREHARPALGSGQF